MDKNSERFKELRHKKVRLIPFTVEKITESPIRPTSLETTGILKKMGLSSVESCVEIQGGFDSRVFRITAPGAAYALRLLPSQKYDQFIQEKKMMDIAARNGVPVPKVRKIQKIDGWAVMLMEWGEGQTILEALAEGPENAEILGMGFGKIQARINQAAIPDCHGEPRSWLTPSRQEAEILSAIPRIDSKAVLLHLDYHPLNVLTDGRNVTVVLDWANATFGDCRFDIARTFSIFQLAGHRNFKLHPQILADFEWGWRKGYAELAGPFEQWDSMNLFYAWSGERLKRDLEARMTEEDKKEIDRWTADWLKNK
ncbi:aminoglycoside phosphotransferase (APT) family kinase protein [Planomicrobium soli]|uniref:Aminoglycoside phosphotransferase (APT) family kinase protein n=1 Tax=Planomicrobium soli TaxID=1176648 RepID=A0A2P8H5U3_9BACL|nr:phosphotransferase [Planomicrobium soli]PSL41602.1 aminoglycoside phosphotransferase (APT) family kinase protein [Planomicrobium soli]